MRTYLLTGFFLCGLSSFFSLSGQVSDAFTDGDFLQNPTWQGDVADFEVQNQQLRLISVGTDTSYLSVANASIDGAEWNLWVRLSFAPSDNNFFRYYLVSDQANLRAPLNGYFLRYGENGSLDGLDLWRQTGSSVVKIFDGPSSPNAALTNQFLRIKVTRQPGGTWQLFADYAGGYALQSLGTLTDNTFSSTSFSGVWCRYTTSNSSGFYFDDFYAGPIVLDTDPPQISDVLVTAPDTVLVLFSEPVTPATAQNASFYSLSGGIGNPASVLYNPLQADRVRLVLSAPLVSEQVYTLQINSVQDFAGNTMNAYSGPVSLYFPASFDLLMTEIMADPTPAVGLPEKEYIELVNRKNIPVNLNGWKLRVNTTLRNLPAVSIPPGGYLLLTADPPDTAFQGISVAGVPSFPAIPNTGASLSLIASSGISIHQVNYDLSWYGDAQKDDGGWSLELINLTDICSGASNWTASENPSGGSPGAVNSVNNTQIQPFIITSVLASNSNSVDVHFSQIADSASAPVGAFTVTPSVGLPDSVRWIEPAVLRLYYSVSFQPETIYQLAVSASVSNCSGVPLSGGFLFPFTYYVPQPFDILITEIMADPDPAVGLPAAEFVELHNRTGFPINITGWKFQVGSTVKTIPNGTLPGNGYLLLSADPLPVLFSILNAVGIPSFPLFSNAGAVVSLLSPDDQLIHQVAYSVDWYQDPAKDEGGWSLEMINPLDFCNDVSNWTACQNFTGGTPAAPNSVFNPQPVTFNIESVSPSGNSAVDIIFSQIVNQSNVIIQDFSIEPQIGIPDSVVFITPYSCRLFFSTPFAQQQVYNLSVSSAFTNCASQSISGSLSFGFTFYTPVQNDVIITEIMADESPSQGLPLFEYVEVYNRTSLPLQLGGWTFSTEAVTVSLPTYQLGPGSFVVLGRSEAESSFSGPFLAVSGFPSLTNDGGTLVLRNAENKWIHSVSYSDDWIRETFKREGGWSMEMRDRNNPCAGISNWAASIHPDGGTPGGSNSVDGSNPDVGRPFPLRVGIPAPDSLIVYFSETLKLSTLSTSYFSFPEGPGSVQEVVPVEPRLDQLVLKSSGSFVSGFTYQLLIRDSVSDCAGNFSEIKAPLLFRVPEETASGDVIINEVLFDPKGDGVDFLEFYNRSDKSVDLVHLFLTDYDSLSNTLTSQQKLSDRPAILMPGDHVVFSVDREQVYQQYFTSHPQAFWNVTSLPSLSNSGGSVALVNQDLQVMDAFTFSDDFHFSLLSNPDGVSLERINPEGVTQSLYNWTSAAASVGYGTPGYTNSQTGAAGEGDGAISLSPEIFSPDQDGFEDVLFIRYQFEKPGNVLSIKVLDEGGRLVKKLINNAYCGISGEFIWDGGTDNGIMPKIGIYLLVAEWYNEDGTRGRAKKTCVLATRL